MEVSVLMHDAVSRWMENSKALSHAVRGEKTHRGKDKGGMLHPWGTPSSNLRSCSISSTF